MSTQRRQWLSVQASLRSTVDSCSQTAPHGGNPNSISTLLTVQCREKPQPREGGPPGVTQCLSHSGNIHDCPPSAQSHQETPKGASGSKVRSTDEVNTNSGDPAQ